MQVAFLYENDVVQTSKGIIYVNGARSHLHNYIIIHIIITLFEDTLSNLFKLERFSIKLLIIKSRRGEIDQEVPTVSNSDNVPSFCQVICSWLSLPNEIIRSLKNASALKGFKHE